MTRQSGFARDIFSAPAKFYHPAASRSMIASIPVALFRIPRYEKARGFASSRAQPLF
jgi:hypothetical protein